jgi:hypothetical protein
VRRIALVGLLLGLLVPAAQASADPTLPWDIAVTTPASGGTFAPALTPIAFEFKSSITGMSNVSVEVSTQNVPGQDGTLADDFQTDFFLGYQSDAYPGTYRAASHGGAVRWWLNVPGTYYWQVKGSCYMGCSAQTQTLINNDPNYAVKNNTPYMSPVFTYTVATPVPVAAPQPKAPTVTGPAAPQGKVYFLPLDVAGRRAKSYAVSHYHARKPTASCQRRFRSTVVCSVRWRAKGKRRFAALEVTYGRDGYWVQKTL